MNDNPSESGATKADRAKTSPLETVPTKGALLGLDFGTRRWGISVCNSEQTLAVPVETWNASTPERNLKHLKELIDDYRIVGIVIGLPVQMSGDEGDQAQLVKTFGKWVATQTKKPVAYWDERHSSNEAEVLLWQQGISPTQAKEKLDRLAAQIILQSFLDAPDRSQRPQPYKG